MRSNADLANPTEMVERVARALCGWSEDASYCSTHWRAWIELATIAVAAMLEPTEAMEDVTIDHDEGQYPKAGEVWKAMIAEALGARTK